MFVANMARVVDRLGASPETPVQVVAGADDICSSCPHMSNGICGRPDQQVDSIDRRIREKLGLEEGQTTTWSSILDTIRDNIDPFRLGEVCAGCRWLDLDYCTKGLAALAGLPVEDD